MRRARPVDHVFDEKACGPAARKGGELPLILAGAAEHEPGHGADLEVRGLELLGIDRPSMALFQGHLASGFICLVNRASRQGVLRAMKAILCPQWLVGREGLAFTIPCLVSVVFEVMGT